MIEPDEIKMLLINFIFENKPLIVTNNDLFVIFRSSKLMLVSGYELRIGDIRILQAKAIDYVKGLTDDQWTTLVTKCVTLSGIVNIGIREAISGTNPRQ